MEPDHAGEAMRGMEMVSRTEADGMEVLIGLERIVVAGERDSNLLCQSPR